MFVHVQGGGDVNGNANVNANVNSTAPPSASSTALLRALLGCGARALLLSCSSERARGGKRTSARASPRSCAGGVRGGRRVPGSRLLGRVQAWRGGGRCGWVWRVCVLLFDMLQTGSISAAWKRRVCKHAFGKSPASVAPFPRWGWRPLRRSTRRVGRPPRRPCARGGRAKGRPARRVFPRETGQRRAGVSASASACACACTCTSSQPRPGFKAALEGTRALGHRRVCTVRCVVFGSSWARWTIVMPWRRTLLDECSRLRGGLRERYRAKLRGRDPPRFHR